MYKIIIFGTGGLAHFLSENLDKSKAEILAYVDTINLIFGNNIDGIPVIELNKIENYVYDYIIIGFSDIIKGFDILQKYGISKDKIVAYSFNGAYDYKKNYWQNKIEEIIHKEFNDRIVSDIFLVPSKSYYLCSMNIRGESYTIESDFVREQTLILISWEIRRKLLKGSVAELGVFRGDFSKKINNLFPDKKLYMFDTFEGFSQKDILSDNMLQNGEKLNNFDNVTVEQVLQKMPYRENCIIKKGFFPDTYDLGEEEFSFVSIDADLYAPVKSGLEIFYPRLNKGGISWYMTIIILFIEVLQMQLENIVIVIVYLMFRFLILQVQL